MDSAKECLCVCVYKYICVLHAGCKKECKPGPPDDKRQLCHLLHSGQYFTHSLSKLELFKMPEAWHVNS